MAGLAVGRWEVRDAAKAARRRFYFCGAMIFLMLVQPANADELKLDAAALFERSASENVCLAEDGKSIGLRRGEVIEDDGPAAGFSYQPNEENLAGGVLVRKELLIPAPQAREATLLVAPGGELKATINGRPAELTPAGKQGNYWQAYRFDGGLLREGKNTIVLGGAGKLWIARDDEYARGSNERTRHPNRSAKSTDGGQTWNDQQLGAKANVDGEYYVRIHLDHFQPSGRLTLPVLDLGNLSHAPLSAPVAEVGPVSVKLDAATPSATSVRTRVRSGTTLKPDAKNWSDWQELSADGRLAKARGRFMQLDCELATSDRAVSPQVRGITIASEPERGEDWTKALRVVSVENPTIVRSSIPFHYEPFDQPKLAAFRKRYELDKVVAGAKSEWELIERLAGWSAMRWQKGHLGKVYPAWDAAEILKPFDDGTPVGGFCLQYNVVFLQACESFGLVGRVLSLGPGNMLDKIRGGHETVEIWSNEHQKWAYVDGNTAWCFVDAKSRTPMSLLELRERQLAALAGRPHEAVEMVRLAETKYDWQGLTTWPPFMELKLVPRSNFCAQSSPLPLNQGMRGWFWTGHYLWTDRLAPPRLLYTQHVCRRGDWEWTLNQAGFALESLAEDGQIRVHLDTETPGFDTFVARVDGGEDRAVTSGFVWELKPGVNRLELRARNIAGRLGPVSSIAIERRSQRR